MASFSRYPSLTQAVKEYVENALNEGDGSISCVEELAIVRAAADDTVQQWAISRQSKNTETRRLANQLVTDEMERVSRLALSAARIKAAMTPATVITIIVPMIQRCTAIIYSELSALPDIAERIHRRISDELRMDIATPTVASVGRVVRQIEETVPEVFDDYEAVRNNLLDVANLSGMEK